MKKKEKNKKKKKNKGGLMKLENIVRNNKFIFFVLFIFM
jgi:hypothetical protein